MKAPDALQAAGDLRTLLEAWPEVASPQGSGAAEPNARGRVLGRVRGRVAGRVQSAIDASAGMVTLRGAAGLGWQPLAEGVRTQPLYRAATASRRPGEPRSAQLLELAAGASCSFPAGLPREWLVLQGQVEIDALSLGPLDHRADDGAPATVSSASGARIYVREADRVVVGVEIQRDDPSLWLDFAPGVRRRLMWTDGAQAAMLYATEPGAAVPHHGHRHDEECLMLAGELFLDDILLREGEYQLAPKGTEHREVTTDTGCLLFAHGDLELALV